jgi:hypothetical protein
MLTQTRDITKDERASGQSSLEDRKPKGLIARR